MVKECSELGLVSRCRGEARSTPREVQTAGGACSSGRSDSEIKLCSCEGEHQCNTND